jgi:hypothetical protein
MPILDLDKLHSHIVRDASGCWRWTGNTNGAGYGTVRLNRRKFYVHRLMYERCTESLIPVGLVIDHLCRHTLCCNPEHLEPVTVRENVRRGKKGMQTHCVHGHPFDVRNTYTTSAGHRQCRACTRERARAYRCARRNGR